MHEQSSVKIYNNKKAKAYWVTKENSKQPDAVVRDDHQTYQEFKADSNYSSFSQFSSKDILSLKEGVVPNKSYSANVELAALFLMIFFMALFRYFKNTRFDQFVFAPFHLKSPQTILKEGQILNENLGVFFIFNYLLIGALFLFSGYGYYVKFPFLPISELNLIWIFFSFLGLFCFLKIFVVQLVSYLFNEKGVVKDYLGLFLLYTSVQGIYLLPLILGWTVLQYGIFLWLAILWVVFNFIFRIFQLYLCGRQLYGFSNYHIILYLCTLEILPIALIVKAFFLVN
ncbi:MAG: DUF4271 domain-containing protein [Bacteroidales bacterium]